jgi:hypothetical protein
VAETKEAFCSVLIRVHPRKSAVNFLPLPLPGKTAYNKGFIRILEEENAFGEPCTGKNIRSWHLRSTAAADQC